MRNLARFMLGLIFATYAALALAIPFAPTVSGTAPALTCGVGSTRTALPVTISGQTQLELQNTGTVTAFFNWGSSTVTAATTDYPVPQGQSKLITVTTGTTHVACITSSSTATSYVTVGFGES